MSPAPNTVLSFLSPSSSGVNTSVDTDGGGGSPAHPQSLSFESLHSEHESPIPVVRVGGVGSAAHSPIVSNEKVKMVPISFPPFHGEAASSTSHFADGGSRLHHHLMLDVPQSSVLCTPSTPPTTKHAKCGKPKRMPPAAGSRANDLPHISTGALRRKQHQPADGSAPILKTLTRGLAALLTTPSPPFGPTSSMQPNSAPFAAVSPVAGIDADALQLALEGESSLMQALNSAAKKGQVRRAAIGRLEHDEDDDGADTDEAGTPVAARMQSHLNLPVRTLSAPSPLQQLTSPMICRPASSVAWATRILPNLYLGNAKHAFDLAQLHRHGVTHIVNAADDVPNYHPSMFCYKNLHVADWGQDRGIRRVFKAVHAYVTKAGFSVTPEEELTRELELNAADVECEKLNYSAAGAAATANAADSVDSACSVASASSSSSCDESAPPSRPVVILLHCAKGQNRSVTILLALLLLVYPDWSLDRAHLFLLASGHGHTCPFPDNRAELMHFERQRRGANTMTDKDFLTRFEQD